MIGVVGLEGLFIYIKLTECVVSNVSAYVGLVLVFFCIMDIVINMSNQKGANRSL